MTPELRAADKADDVTYETGETPEVGDVVECLPGEGSFPNLTEGEQYTVVEVDCGYLYWPEPGYPNGYGWGAARFALVERNGVRR